MKFKTQLFVGLVAAALTALSIMAHIVGPSTLHYPEDTRKVTVTYHLENEIFNKRPLTTSMVVFLVEAAGLSYQTSFFLLQFFLYFLTGPAFYYYLRQLKFTNGPALGGMALFLLCQPVLMAHFEPIHTWDDFWMYIFVPLSLGLALGGRIIPAALAMSAALLSRETTLLYLPFLFMAACKSASKRKAANGVLAIAVSIIAFLVLRIALYGTETAPPYDCLTFNFENALRTRDTIFSFLVSLGFLWVIGIKQLFSTVNNQNDYWNSVRIGAVITIIGFVASTLLYGHARESRLFVPPAIFLIPLTLWYDQENVIRLKELFISNKLLKLLASALLMVLSYLAVKYFFSKFEYRTWPDANRAYMMMHVWIVLAFSFFELWKMFVKLRQTSPKTR